MKQFCRKLLALIAYRTGRGVTLWRRVCRPSGEEWAAWLKRHGGLHSMGEGCSIQCNVFITDPAYVRLGNNVRLSGCTLFGHDGSVNMLNRAFGLKLDKVGKIDIGNHVFIGHNAVVMPNVTIGDCVVVAAGSVVTADLPPHSVYGGVPAKRLSSIHDTVARLNERNRGYPWRPLIEAREHGFDRELEPALQRMRVAHFYGEVPSQG